jgi:hypothetical protein
MATSSEDDQCPLTDLPRYSCGHCTGTDARARDRVGQRITMTARYTCRCVYCDDPVRPGDPKMHTVQNRLQHQHRPIHLTLSWLSTG